MKFALSSCTHVVYSYISISRQTLRTLHPLREMEVAKVKYFKENFPNVKFLLSLGEVQNKENTQKYLNLLVMGKEKRQRFINSTISVLNKYDFDGLSLDFPLPKMKTYRWKSLSDKTRIALGKFSISRAKKNKKEISEDKYKHALTVLVQQLRINLQQSQKMLAFNALPHVDVQSN